MAIATFERDPALDTGTTDLRFRLLQSVFATSEASFWRALDRRTGKTCMVRMIEIGREQSARRLGDLHRERTLAERIAHPAVLRTDVPTIEDERIFQIVEPEPLRVIDPDTEGGRLAVLNLLVGAAAVLADAHARGVFHGGFSRASCLRGSDGRLLVQGFIGDASNAAAIRDGAAEDHRAFLEFASEMLKGSGGAPPRLRRYFNQHLAGGAPKPSPGAMAELCADLRESLEDTFPWPIGGTGAAGVAGDVPALTVDPEITSRATPGRVRAPIDEATIALPILDGKREAQPPKPRPIAAEAQTAPIVAPSAGPSVAPPAVAIAAAATRAPIPPAKAAAPRSPAAPTVVADQPAFAARAAAAPRADAPGPVNASSAPTRATPEPSQQAPGSRPWRPWIAAAIVAAIAAAALQHGSKGGRAPQVDPATQASPATQGRVSPAVPAPVPVPSADPAPARTPAVSVAGSEATLAMALKEAVAPVAPRADAASRRIPAAVTPAPVRQERAAPVSPSRAGARVVAAPVARLPTPSVPAADARSAEGDGPSPQAIRSRVATLVSGGNRALTALEPGVAAEAFAAALALAPQDRAALEGSQRARRLQGVGALVLDAREAAARGDHARAVQGYSQALANDPRNRGLADALAAARRNLGRDATSALLAEGHAALGAGRFEAARDAFEKALEANPSAPGARRAAAQASAAILLRGASESRRAELVARNTD